MIIIIIAFVLFCLFVICWFGSRANEHIRQQRITNYRLKMIAEGKPIETGWKGGLLHQFLNRANPSRGDALKADQKKAAERFYEHND